MTVCSKMGFEILQLIRREGVPPSGFESRWVLVLCALVLWSVGQKIRLGVAWLGPDPSRTLGEKLWQWIW